MSSKVFVGNLSWDSTEESLKEHFSQAGEVEEAVIIRDRMTNRSKGFGFVTFSSEEGAQKAIAELNESELDGRNIRVDEAKPPKQSFDE